MPKPDPLAVRLEVVATWIASNARHHPSCSAFRDGGTECRCGLSFVRQTLGLPDPSDRDPGPGERMCKTCETIVPLAEVIPRTAHCRPCHRRRQRFNHWRRVGARAGGGSRGISFQHSDAIEISS